MPFDLGSAIAVREREDGLLEKDTFDLSSAVTVEEISAPKEPFRYTPPLTEAERARAVISQSYKEAGKQVPFGLKADWVLTSEPAKMVAKNILGILGTGGIIPFYNMAKGIVNAASPKSDIGKMVFDSAYKGLAENKKIEPMGAAAAKAYPDLPWQVTGTMGALAEVLIFMPTVIKGVGELLTKDKQFTMALNAARQSPKWGDYVSGVAKKAKQPIEVVDQALYRKLWELRGEANPFAVLNTNLKRATGIDLFSEAGQALIKRPKIGQVVNFTDPQGLIKAGTIKEVLGERAVINLEGKEIIATLSQLSLPEVKEIKPPEVKEPQPTGEGQKPPIEPPKTGEVVEKPAQPLQPTEIPPQRPIPPKTPEVPPVPPPEEGLPQEPDAVNRIIQALKEAKPIRKETEALYKAERGRRIAKAKAMGQKIEGEAGFYAQLGSLKGQLPKAQFETLRGKIAQPEIDALFDKIRTSDMNEWDKIGAQTGLGKIFGEFGGQVPTEGELKQLHEVFGKEFTEAVLSNRTILQKLSYAVGELLNIPRSVMASFDLSAPFRQGAFLIGKPKQFIPAFGEMFKFFGSEKALSESTKQISLSPNYDLMREHGLSLMDLGTSLTGREEKFMSQWAEKIPLAGPIIRMSSRAYTGFLNKLRADVFDDLIKKARELGIEESDKFLDDLVEFVNAATGRGKLPGKLDRIAVALNSIFFSPRLMASRLSLLNPMFYTSKEPFVRKEALKSLLSFFSAWMTFLGLLALAGWEVGTDWRSSDFAKAKKGNLRIDPGAGFQQYLRMTGQLVTGEYVSSVTGKVSTLGEGYKPLTRFDILLRQLENKEAPVASFITALLRQKTFMGEDVNVTKEVANRFTPMVLQDLVDIARQSPELLPFGVLGLFGVGIQSYESKPRRSTSTRPSATKKPRSSSTK